MPKLLDSLEVKTLTLRNRIVMPPMYTGLASPNGAVTSRLVEHYAQRSKAIGLLEVEHSYVHPNGKLSRNQLGIHNDRLISGLEVLASTIHALGTPVIAQISHAGSAARVEIIGEKPVAPSQDDHSEELTPSGIERLIAAFALAAERAMKSGFDGVEVHGAHGFLLNQFFSPLTNHRNDKYGGSLKNRMRFPLEVIDGVREKTNGRLLVYRLGSDDLNTSGTRIEDSQLFAKKLEEAGVDIIDISGGLCGSRPASLQGKQGYFVTQAEQIKNVVGVPVIGVGGIVQPEFADRIVKEGRVDLVAVGRALLEDPQWATKAAEILR